MTTLTMSLARWFRIAGRRLRAVVRRETLDRELDRELAFHLDQLTAEHVASGMAIEDARLAAKRALGNMPLLAEECRDHRRVGWLLDFRQDVAFGLRMQARHPGVTIVIIASLGIGIGANAAVLGSIDAILRTQLLIPDAERVVVARTYRHERPEHINSVTAADFLAWDEQNRTLATVALTLGNQADFGDSATAPAERIQGVAATAALFEVLRVPPLHGRVFIDEDVRAANTRLALVLSHRLWQRRYGGDPAIVGARIQMAGRTAEIVGVMPAGLHYPNEGVEYWVPLVVNRSPVQSPQRLFGVTARLKEGVTIAQAEADLNRIAALLGRASPERHAGWRVRVDTVREAMFGWTDQPLWTLEAAVALVLLVACTNVAALLLTRLLVRRAELGIRAALGAGRGRLVRQLLAEIVLLSVAGGLLGVALAWVGVKALVAIPPPPGGVALDVALDGRMLAVTALIAVGTGMLFGAIPALAWARWHSIATRHGHWRELLVAAQVAVTVVLLIGAGLLTRSFLFVITHDMHFETSRLLTFQVNLPLGEFMQPRDALRDLPYFEITPPPAPRFQRIHEQLRTVPGALAVAGSSIPIVNNLVIPTVDVTARSPAPSDAEPRTVNAAYFLITPDFFRSIAATIVRGRDLGEGDGPASPWVALVNETAAHVLWPGQDPLGRHLTIPLIPEERPREVIGVVRDIPLMLPPGESRPVIYLSYLQQPAWYPLPGANLLGQMTFMLRAADDPMALLPAARRIVAELEPERPLANVTTMEGQLRARIPRRGDYVVVIGAFALAATLLAAIGVYGIVAYNAARRTREIGIRLALGASTRDIVRLVGRRALLLAAAGLSAGLAGALAFTQLLRSQLWGVTPTDPLTFAGAGALLLSVCVLACALPTRRATAVNPTIALRCE